ncbi:MAG: glycerol-3-phosphate 1-O-acyltransferase PlsY [Candidatus Dormibacteria bacterium]
MPGRFADVGGCAAGYLIGSVPIGVLMGRALRGLDVREHGSHSMGTTNVLRLVGPSAAAATFALDVGKGTAAVAVARRLGADTAGQAAAGLAAIVGHNWPVFAHFRGGKGVATGFGALLMSAPAASPYAIGAGLAALGATRIVSVASLTACAGAVVGGVVEELRRRDRAALAFTGLAATLIAVRHGGNLRRLMRGEEPRVSLRRRGAPAAP